MKNPESSKEGPRPDPHWIERAGCHGPRLGGHASAANQWSELEFADRSLRACSSYSCLAAKTIFALPFVTTISHRASPTTFEPPLVAWYHVKVAIQPQARPRWTRLTRVRAARTEPVKTGET